MRITARAKINWTLDILGKRADGYHEIDTVLQPLTLCDDIDITPSDTLSLHMSGMEPSDDNLVLKAARALQRRAGIMRGAAISLVKRIPIGAGLGGGSADAAATLRVLNTMWDARLSDEALYALACTLGADVPYCLTDAPSRARGIGEKLSPIRSRLCAPIVLIQPCAGLLTKDVFARYEQLDEKIDIDAAVRSLEQGDLAALSKCAGNALMPAACALQPVIRQAIDDLRKQGASLALMTGSGSAVFGAFSRGEDADNAYRALKDAYPTVLRTQTTV